MQIRRQLRSALVIPVLAFGFGVAGCGTGIDGVAVAQSGAVASSILPTSASPVADSTDCASLTKALGALVADRPYLTEATLPGSNDPTCSWSKGTANVMSTLTVSVTPQQTDPAVIVEMRNGADVVADPRVEKVGGVVLDVVAMALLTPTHSIIVNALDPAVSDATKLDIAFAIAEYLQK